MMRKKYGNDQCFEPCDSSSCGCGFIIEGEAGVENQETSFWILVLFCFRSELFPEQCLECVQMNKMLSEL